jgi:hypothetical protein
MTLLPVSSTVLMGVRQGNPISPFLFVIVMGALSKMISASIDNGFLSSFSMGSRLPELVNISYLLFAYDTLVSVGLILIMFIPYVRYSFTMKLFWV